MLKLYNTLTKHVDPFHKKPGDSVTVYCCGPTVYDYAQIGNFRTYVTTDILVRTLTYLGYQVKFAMNITDVGHLTSDSDTGDDKMEKGAKREGKTAWDIAKFYTDAFLADSKSLNLIEPDARPKPTQFIESQIRMVQTLLDKGYAYCIDDGIYFDTQKSNNYGVLTGQNRDELMAGARVEPNPDKRNPTDFALWKFSPNPSADGKKRDMEWESPWGVGFPGWHIECSAMSMDVLQTNQLDIHTGGMDLIPIHHTNEIAQSEAASGVVPFVHFWVHGQFLTVDGEKMSKSKHNFYRITDVTAKGFDPLALRYFYFTAHYRQYVNFTWEGIEASQRALTTLRTAFQQLHPDSTKTVSEDAIRLKEAFRDVLEDDMNMPKAVAVVWEVVKSKISDSEKQNLLSDFDRVLGLDIDKSISVSVDVIPNDISQLVAKREACRKNKSFTEADELRKSIEDKGYLLKDTSSGVRVTKKA